MFGFSQTHTFSHTQSSLEHLFITGHLAQDCFKTQGDKTYDLIPEMDEYMESLSQDKEETSHKHKKRRKVIYFYTLMAALHDDQAHEAARL